MNSPSPSRAQMSPSWTLSRIASPVHTATASAVLRPRIVLQIAVVKSQKESDWQGYRQCGHEASDLDHTETRLLRQVVRHIEIDAHKAAVIPWLS